MKEVSRPVGRPNKIDRDATVFMARWWRTSVLAESAGEANRWIIDHWAEHTPSGERPGITDEAHVRAALRRAKCSWLGEARFVCNDGIRLLANAVSSVDDTRCAWIDAHKLPADFEIDGCAIGAIQFVLHNVPRVWFWMPGLTEARRGYSRPVETAEESSFWLPAIQRHGRTQVAAAIAEYVGLRQPRTTHRLHRPQWIFG